MTVLDVLQSTTAYFKKREIESPRLNAEHLLAHVLDRKRIELYLEFERVVAEEELAPLRELVRRRGQGEPLQHLLGTVEFCGHIFKCDQRALVPRPETEELVEFIIQSTINSESFREQGHQPSTILDVGTGSGVIGLSLAAHFPEARVHAIDISDDALAQARENAERLGLSGRVQFTKGDLLESFSERFAVIAANLPYVSTQDRQSLAREVLCDPEVAVFGGDRGDELIRKLIEQAPKHLQPNGLLALEIGIGQCEALFELLTQKNYHDIESKNDYAGIPRFLFARYG
jgi:release factor glutamine methyltransferase